MKKCFIIILLLLSACSPKNVNLPSMSQQDTKPQPMIDGLATMREGLARIYAVSPKGEFHFNAQKGSAYVKWDEKGVTVCLSRDFVPKPGDPWAEGFNKFLTQFHQSAYSNAQGKIFIPGTDVYLQFDDKGIALFMPRTEDAAFYSSRGNVYHKSGQYDQAISDYSKALEMNPKDAMAYHARGAAYFKKGEYDSAISDFNKAIEINPKDADSYVWRGDAYQGKARYEEAILDYNKAIEIDPKDVAAYNNLAWVLSTAKEAHIRNGKKALDLATKACELTNWKNPACLDTLAAAYAREGNFENAVKWQERALESAQRAQRARFMERLECYKKHRPWPSD